MGKIFKRAALALCVLVLSLGIFGTKARAAEPLRVELPVRVSVNGTAPQQAETFRVELTAGDNTCPMPQGTANGAYTLALEAGAEKCLELTFPEPGVYSYSLRQICGTRADCSYDSHVYYLTAFVTNDDTGGLELGLIMRRDQENTKQENVVFENRYAQAAQVTLTARKTLDGKTPKDGAFSFQLLDETGNVVDTAVNTGEDVIFDTLAFAEPGTYRYRMKECPGSDETIVYDETVYDVTVSVTLEGDYTAAVSWEKGGKAWEGTPVFANKTREAEADPPKTDNPKTGDSFQSVLWAGLIALSLVGGTAVVCVKKRDH